MCSALLSFQSTIISVLSPHAYWGAFLVGAITRRSWWHTGIAPRHKAAARANALPSAYATHPIALSTTTTTTMPSSPYLSPTNNHSTGRVCAWLQLESPASAHRPHQQRSKRRQRDSDSDSEQRQRPRARHSRRRVPSETQATKGRRRRYGASEERVARGHRRRAKREVT